MPVVNAVNSGVMLTAIRVFATVVIVSAIMKQQYMMPHITPDTTPRRPVANTIDTALPRCWYSNTAATNKAANALRQNVT